MKGGGQREVRNLVDKGLILMTQKQHQILSDLKPLELPGNPSWFPQLTHSPILLERGFHRLSSLLKPPHFQLLDLGLILLRK